MCACIPLSGVRLLGCWRSRRPSAGRRCLVTVRRLPSYRSRSQNAAQVTKLCCHDCESIVLGQSSCSVLMVDVMSAAPSIEIMVLFSAGCVCSLAWMSVSGDAHDELTLGMFCVARSALRVLRCAFCASTLTGKTRTPVDGTLGSALARAHGCSGASS